MLLGFWVDSWKLGTAHMLVSLLGAFMALYVMQLWSRGDLSKDEHPIITHARRFGLMLLALALIWSVSYATDKRWEPWPADFLTNVAIDIMLGAAIVNVWCRKLAKAAH